MQANNHITTLIPQRAPFVMLDKLLHSDETTTQSTFLIRPDNIFVEEGVLKEPGLVENIAQTVAASAGYQATLENRPVAIGYIGSVKNLEVFFLPKTGEQIVTAITVENQIFNVTMVTGKITCNDKLAAQCQMKIFINQP
jgi:predicted hotdog family 3-hydroxylacyl-ACP dehydratase